MRKIVIAMSLVAISLVAADYSQMTTDELSALRGTVAVEDREVFRAEMQSRMQAMTPQERQQYRTDRGIKKGQGSGSGEKIQQRLKDGSGVGNVNKSADRTKNQGTRQRLKDGSGAGK